MSATSHDSFLMSRKGLTLWALPLLLAACNLAPHYSRPDAPVADAFKGAGAPPPSAGWKYAEPKDESLRANWWESFNEPVLTSLEEQVKINNQTIAQAEANYRNSRALVSQARAAFFPVVTTDPGVTRQRTSSNTHGSNSSGTYNTFSLPFDGSYEIDLWGRIRNQVAQAQANADASAADVESAILSTQAEVASDYFQIRSLDEEVRIYEDTIKSYRSDLQLTQQLFKDGIDSDEDVAEAQSQLATTIAQASDVKVTRATVEHAIAVLLGKSPSGFALAEAPFTHEIPTVPVMVPSDVLERRPDIAAAERNVFAMNAQIGIARTAYFPTLDLTAAAGFQSSAWSKLLNWPSRFWSIDPNLSATIFDWGAQSAVNQEARAQYDAAAASYRQTVLSAFQDVEDNLATLSILEHESHEQADAVKAAQHRLDLAMERYRLGIDSYLNVTVAQTALLTNRQSQLAVEQRQLAASVGLIRALGGGWSTQVQVDKKGVPQIP